MHNLVPRLVGPPEAGRLGVQSGWYGTKTNGTFMTGPLASLAACIEAIDLIPEPVTDARPGPALPKPISYTSVYQTNMHTRTAYQIGRKPPR
jgi:hypothetical protein